MATHSSILVWRIPGTVEPWWAAVYGVAQSRTRLTWLSSNSSRDIMYMLPFLNLVQESSIFPPFILLNNPLQLCFPTCTLKLRTKKSPNESAKISNGILELKVRIQGTLWRSMVRTPHFHWVGRLRSHKLHHKPESQKTENNARSSIRLIP